MFIILTIAQQKLLKYIWKIYYQINEGLSFVRFWLVSIWSSWALYSNKVKQNYGSSFFIKNHFTVYCSFELDEWQDTDFDDRRIKGTGDHALPASRSRFQVAKKPFFVLLWSTLDILQVSRGSTYVIFIRTEVCWSDHRERSDPSLWSWHLECALWYPNQMKEKWTVGNTI